MTGAKYKQLIIPGIAGHEDLKQLSARDQQRFRRTVQQGVLIPIAHFAGSISKPPSILINFWPSYSSTLPEIKRH